MQVVAQRVSRGRNRWIDTMKDCLKRGFDVRQARRMVYDSEGEFMGRSPGHEPLS